MRLRQARLPWLWPLLLTVTGVVLLLDNFLLLGDFNAYTLLPLLLVIAGAQILLRGDLLPQAKGRRFGITRGSVESATLEISSGEIDVELRALQENWRLPDDSFALIAGQFASETRPQLDISEGYAHLQMKRSQTPWYSFADWQAGLARDLPWQVVISTYLGQVNADFSGLILHDAVIATGMGDIRLVCPAEAFGPVYVRSTLGAIQIITPPGYNTRIVAVAHRMFTVHADAERYDNPEPHIYVAREAAPDAPIIDIQISGSLGDAYLA